MAQMTGSSALGAVCGLLLLSRLASAARMGMTSSGELLVNATPEECGREVAEVPSGKTLQTYFDGLRRSYDILDESASFLGEGGAVDPEKCTKKDVCLLMRQLDMDFYERARTGLLQDADYEIPPTKGWVMKGSCKEQLQTRGFKMVPVTDPAVCEAEAEAKGALFQGAAKSKLSARAPAGCVIVRKDGKTAKAYLNENSASVAEAGTSYDSGKKESLEVLCEMDRSLSESAAAYYSPYKLKPSMHGREAHSTSCSFGMFAYLAKLRETMSPCAKILTYAAHQRFRSAEEALEMAEVYEKDGKGKEAQTLKDYVESIRQKSVLMDVIANNWCPGIWTASQSSGGTCLAPRVMSWTAEHEALAKEEAEAKSAKVEKPKASRPKTRMEAAQRARGEKWGTTGNQGLINKVGALSGLKAEDQAGDLLLAARDADTASSLDSWGKPIKSALTEEACPALDDESLAQLLAGKPQAPPSFFREAAAAGP